MILSNAIFGIVWNMNPSVIPGVNIPRWYGVMWALGIYAAYIAMNRLYKNENMPEKAMDKTFLYIVLGAVIGARLGHCFFYDPGYYLKNPIEILYIWEGGLASHGGTLGIIIAGYILIRKVLKKEVLWMMDRLSTVSLITAAFIRIGNLFNHEIVGIKTTGAFGFQFLRNDIHPSQAMDLTQAARPESVDAAYSLIANDPQFAHVLAEVPLRYPAQLFEALAYFLIFVILMFLYWRTNAGKLRGFIMGVFMVLCFTARFFIEFIKENQTDLFTEEVNNQIVNSDGLNMGQYLSLPFIAVGLFFMLRKIKEFKMGRVSYMD